jgi:hypothetical protein
VVADRLQRAGYFPVLFFFSAVTAGSSAPEHEKYDNCDG